MPWAAHQTASHGISGEVSNDTRQRPAATTAVNSALDTTQVKVSGERGLITAAVLISVAYLLLGQATGAVSLMDAIAFAGAAIPASILTLFVCGHFFHRLSIAAGLF